MKKAKIEVLNINFKSYDHRLLDQTIKKIISYISKTSVKMHGPIPLPTKIEKFSVLASPFKYKKAQEQFERRTFKRLLQISNVNSEVLDILKKFNIPAGIEILLKNKQGSFS